VLQEWWWSSNVSKLCFLVFLCVCVARHVAGGVPPAAAAGRGLQVCSTGEFLTQTTTAAATAIVSSNAAHSMSLPQMPWQEEQFVQDLHSSSKTARGVPGAWQKRHSCNRCTTQQQQQQQHAQGATHAGDLTPLTGSRPVSSDRSAAAAVPVALNQEAEIFPGSAVGLGQSTPSARSLPAEGPTQPRRSTDAAAWDHYVADL